MVQPQHNVVSPEYFTKQLLDIGNEKMVVYETTQGITLLPSDHRQTKSFQNILQHYKNHQWLGARLYS